jgi:hypothetical protein
MTEAEHFSALLERVRAYAEKHNWFPKPRIRVKAISVKR